LWIYHNNKEDIVVEADRERLTQVISNLLSDVIKFTKDIKGGEDGIVALQDPPFLYVFSTQ
jgi:signal transduction histidine kinase